MSTAPFVVLRLLSECHEAAIGHITDRFDVYTLQRVTTSATRVAQYACSGDESRWFFFGWLCSSSGSQVAGTACLGAWQSTRYFWKVEQIELRKQALAQEPSTLTGSVTVIALLIVRVFEPC
jgi:hypothetical protein